jgi:hypothetical protein
MSTILSCAYCCRQEKSRNNKKDSFFIRITIYEVNVTQ